jgi:hypothetical protein
MSHSVQTPFSFYIPRMKAFWNQDQISLIISRTIGSTIERVDFGDFLSSLNTEDLRYAFIHFTFIDPYYQTAIRYEIELQGYFKLQVSDIEFWMLFPNNNPIPRTHLNTHQLADITKKQEERIASLEAELDILKTLLHKSFSNIVLKDHIDWQEEAAEANWSFDEPNYYQQECVPTTTTEEDKFTDDDQTDDSDNIKKVLSKILPSSQLCGNNFAKS